MKDLKMIVMDLDGTLITNQQTILPYTQEVLMKYQAQGISLVLSSGRDIESIQRIGKMLNMADYPQNYYICLNGLEIYDMQGSLLHQEEKLQQKDAYSLAKLAKEYHLDVIFFFKDCLYTLEYGKTGIINNHFMTSIKYSVQDVHDIPDDYFTCLKKVAFIQNSSTMKTIIQDLQESVKERYHLCLVEDEWVEINPLGLSKGHALKTLSQLSHISLNEIIAFGNGENDSDMLITAGCGVAMENSFDSVKAIADDVCGHCEQDGIAHYLNQFYPITKAGN